LPQLLLLLSLLLHSITFVGIIYTLMSLCLVMMVPYHQLDPAASFATAFTQVGLPWGQYLVALGAVLGIVTGVLVSGGDFAWGQAHAIPATSGVLSARC
jgi:amino acid transporter